MMEEGTFSISMPPPMSVRLLAEAKSTRLGDLYVKHGLVMVMRHCD